MTIEELKKAMDDADAVWIARNAYDAAKEAYQDALKEAR